MFITEAYRVSGAGNSFFVMDFPEKGTTETEFREKLRGFARHICSSFPGVNTDGVVFLKPGYEWVFFNSDGSDAEMCGNAARCVAAYIEQIKKQNLAHAVNLKTAAGNVSLSKQSEGLYRVLMPDTKIQGWKDFEGSKVFCVDTGVPHVVFEKKADQNLAQRARWEKSLDPRGSNVTFLEVVGPNKTKAITYERGVENYTLACGTGAVAAASYLKEKSPSQSRFFIQMPGGELEVVFDKDKSYLIGPAQIDFKTVFKEVL